MNLVVTSATLDTAKFAEFFADAGGQRPPIIAIPGKTYPIEFEYKRVSDRDFEKRPGYHVVHTEHSEDDGQCDKERLHILAHQRRTTIQLQTQVVTESTRRLKSTRRFISDFDEISFSRSDPIRAKEKPQRHERQTERRRSVVVWAVASLHDYKRGYWWFEVPKFISTCFEN